MGNIGTDVALETADVVLTYAVALGWGVVGREPSARALAEKSTAMICHPCVASQRV